MTAAIIPWAKGNDTWKDEFEGQEQGSGVSLIFTHHVRRGEGPKLHRHPYAETFIVRHGTVRFTVGEETVDVPAGHIVVVPPHLPHKFSGVSDMIEMIDIHPSPRFITEWL